MVEVSMSGDVDPSTGMIANLADLDAFVERQVLEEFDHKSLNEDVPVFLDKVPTTENLCIEIYRLQGTFSHANHRGIADGGNSDERSEDNRRAQDGLPRGRDHRDQCS